MNKLLASMIFSISSLAAIEFHSYEDALKIQQNNGKIIMIDVVRTGCQYCEDMDKKVFQDKKMSKWINERFIPVKVNLGQDNIPLDIRVNFTPTFFFIDKNSNIIKKIPGSWNIEDFKELTRNIK